MLSLITPPMLADSNKTATWISSTGSFFCESGAFFFEVKMNLQKKYKQWLTTMNSYGNFSFFDFKQN